MLKWNCNRCYKNPNWTTCSRTGRASLSISLVHSLWALAKSQAHELRKFRSSRKIWRLAWCSHLRFWNRALLGRIVWCMVKKIRIVHKLVKVLFHRCAQNLRRNLPSSHKGHSHHRGCRSWNHSFLIPRISSKQMLTSIKLVSGHLVQMDRCSVWPTFQVPPGMESRSQMSWKQQLTASISKRTPSSWWLRCPLN